MDDEATPATVVGIFVADGYKIKDGTCSLPDAPGFGLAVNEDKSRQAKIHADLKVRGPLVTVLG